MASDWQDYIGRSRSSEAVISSDSVQKFQATLGLASQGDGLPLGLHWCIGTEAPPGHSLSADGHAPKGDFLPPIPFPRRMWAAGRLELHAPLRIGQHLQRISEIKAVTAKTGRSGALVFVTLSHRVLANHHLAILEEQDLVFRPELPPGSQPEALPEAPPMGRGPDWCLPDSPLLFRYSAITFNTHRIHYDLPYARDVEGYPGLVVHGPLQATLLADAAARHLKRPLRRFSFRGLAPAYCDLPLHLAHELRPSDSGGLTLNAAQLGRITMQAEAQ